MTGSHNDAKSPPNADIQRAVMFCGLFIQHFMSGLADGGGIQADPKSFAAHGVHGLSAFDALTARHTRGVTEVHVGHMAIIRDQQTVAVLTRLLVALSP